jgi:hypothetical protein
LIVSDQVRGAFIDARASVGTDTWTKTGGATSTSARGCSIQFILPSKRVLMVWGAWTARAISKWVGPVASSRVVSVPENARVRGDGSLGFHG